MEQDGAQSTKRYNPWDACASWKPIFRICISSHAKQPWFGTKRSQVQFLSPRLFVNRCHTGICKPPYIGGANPPQWVQNGKCRFGSPPLRKKPSGNAVVTIQGKDHYLGRYGSKASKTEYDRLIGEWLASGRFEHPSPEASQLTVKEVIAAFWRYAERHYVKRNKIAFVRHFVTSGGFTATRLHPSLARSH